MKCILFVLFMLMVQEHTGLETFLGQKIGTLLNDENAIFREEGTAGKTTYGMDRVKFMGYDCRSFFVKTNPENDISDIFFGIDNRIDFEFYNMMEMKYGKPSKMFKLIKDDTSEHSQVHSIDYSITSVKGSGIQREFNEDPNFIIWDKTNFRLTITLPPNESHILVSYRKL